MRKKNIAFSSIFQPKSTQNSAQKRKHAKKTKKSIRCLPWRPHFRPGTRFWSIFGSQRGAQNRKKTQKPTRLVGLFGYLNTRLSRKRAEESPGGLPESFWRPSGSLRGRFSAKIDDKSSKNLPQNPLPHARNMLEDFAKNQA